MSEAAQVGLPGVEAQRGDVGSDACFTPLDIIKGVTAALGGIVTDPCWHPNSHVPNGVYRYDGRDRGDGLAGEWNGPLWLQPPYSNVMPWAKRFKDHALAGNPSIALVKLDPTTDWWSMMMKARGGTATPMIGLVNHRIKFDGEFAGGGTASFASAFIAAYVAPAALKRFLPMATWMDGGG